MYARFRNGIRRSKDNRLAVLKLFKIYIMFNKREPEKALFFGDF